MLGHSHRHDGRGYKTLSRNIGWVQERGGGGGGVLGQDNSTGVCRCGWASVGGWRKEGKKRIAGCPGASAFGSEGKTR